MIFKDYSYEELDKELLYDILGHRMEVFVVCQGDNYQDVDHFDQKAHHLLAYTEDGEIAGYVRLLPAAVHYDGYDESAFGRLSVKEKYRGTGLGKELVKRAIAWLLENGGSDSVRISAMAYLEKFYSELGFVRTSDIFDIQGVAHVTMLYSPK